MADWQLNLLRQDTIVQAGRNLLYLEKVLSLAKYCDCPGRLS